MEGTAGSGKGNGIVALESDDSELDDFLDDILEHGRNLMRKGSTSRTAIVASSKAGWYVVSSIITVPKNSVNVL